MRCSIIVLICLLATIPCSARIITVDNDGTADFNNIQAAINDSNDGDIIEVQPGTYTGNGNRDIDFLGKEITVRSTDPNDPIVVASTIINCQGTEEERHRGFYFHSDEDGNSILEGITIVNGYAQDEDTPILYVRDSVGGAIFCYYSSPTISHCVIRDNLAPHGYGGGICCRSGRPTITHCTIMNNSTAPYGKGAGIYIWSSNPKINNCLIAKNNSNGRGGGIYCHMAAPSITLCTIAGNAALYMGGGICAYDNDSDSIVNSCIIWDNNAPDGAEIKIRNGSYPTISYCDVRGGFTGTGNFNSNPHFANPTTDDYHLMSDSPCINAGDPFYVPRPNDKDIDGEVRIINGIVDVGIDEFNMEGPLIGVSPRILEFLADEGGPNPEPQILYISNTGTGIINWEIEKDCSWISVVPSSGTSGGEVDEVTVKIDIAETDQGLHECELVIRSFEAGNSPQTVYVSLYVCGNLHVPSQYPNIQSAIDISRNGDTVLLDDGIYTGLGNRDIDLKGKAITVRSENGPESCIIDCEGTYEDNHRGFYFHSGEGSNSVLDGFTITNAYIVVMCEAGAGIYIDNSSPTIRNCIIKGNVAELDPYSLCFCYGGGIYFNGTSLAMTNCIISDNSVGEFGLGGGICCMPGSSTTLRNCIISNNAATTPHDTAGKGGGIYLDYYANSLNVVNCTIAENTASYDGGGIYFEQYENPPRIIIINSILWDNSPNQISTYGGNYKGLVAYCDIQGSWLGAGIIDADPYFADVTSGDYHLKSQAGRWDPSQEEWVKDANTSPCIDSGAREYDWTAELWPNGKRINMGAYGGTPQASMSLSDAGNIADLNNDGSVNYLDMTLFTDTWPYHKILLPGDLDRNGFVDFIDFAIFSYNWDWEQ